MDKIFLAKILVKVKLIAISVIDGSKKILQKVKNLN